MKKDASHLKIASHSKRQKKNIAKRGREIKNKEKSNNSNEHFLIYFSIQKNLCFVRKHIWRYIVYTIIFTLQFFCVAGYLKRNDEATTLIQICIGPVKFLLQSKIFGDRLGILT